MTEQTKNEPLSDTEQAQEASRENQLATLRFMTRQLDDLFKNRSK
jgi:hypothetical protein